MRIHKPREKDPLQTMAVELRQRLPNVDESVRGLLADTLTEWWEVARQAGESEKTLQERAEEVNRSFASGSMARSARTQGWLAALDSEMRMFQTQMAQLAEESESVQKQNQRDDDAGRVWRETQAANAKYRNIMAHRTGKSGRGSSTVVVKL